MDCDTKDTHTNCPEPTAIETGIESAMLALAEQWMRTARDPKAMRFEGLMERVRAAALRGG